MIAAHPAYRPLATHLVATLVATGCAALVVSESSAQTLIPLSFAGIEAGQSIADHQDPGTDLSCRSTKEPRLRICTGSISVSDYHEPPIVSLSLVDERVALATVIGPVTPGGASELYQGLTRRFGPTSMNRQGMQESFQWIKDRQMIRLTVRQESQGLVAAVTLMDGRLLDSLPPP